MPQYGAHQTEGYNRHDDKRQSVTAQWYRQRGVNHQQHRDKAEAESIGGLGLLFCFTAQAC